MPSPSSAPPHNEELASKQQRMRVLLAGFCSQLLCLGIARFAYTPLLPIMQDQTSLNDVSGGWLATINYSGYMLGAFIAASITNLETKDTLYRWGLITAIVTTIGMAIVDNLYLWAFLRFFAGLSSAGSMLLASGLILNWLLRHHFRGELGVHFAGVGIGICLAALMVQGMSFFTFSWDAQWVGFTLLGVLLFLPAWFWLPKPRQLPSQTSQKVLEDRPPHRTFLFLLLAAYFCAGYGFVVNATFIVALIERQPGMDGQGAFIFFMIGLAAAGSAVLWDRLARALGAVHALIYAYGIQVIGILLPVLFTDLTSALLGALLYGGTFVGCVSLVLAMAGRFYPTKPAKLMGKLTLSYGVAQILAPALTGILAETFGNYDLAVYLAAGCVALGMALMIMLKIREKTYSASG